MGTEVRNEANKVPGVSWDWSKIDESIEFELDNCGINNYGSIFILKILRMSFSMSKKGLLPESLLPNYLRPIMEQSFLLMMTVIGSPFLAPSASTTAHSPSTN